MNKFHAFAVYLLIESTSEWTGKRLYIKKLKEEKDDRMLAKICQACDYSYYDVGSRHVTYLEIEEVLIPGWKL